jgi:hypothetical protein
MKTLNNSNKKSLRFNLPLLRRGLWGGLLCCLLLAASCIKNVDEAKQTIVLSAPGDNAAFDLNTAPGITFSWSTADGVDKYIIAFSLNDDMLPSATVDVAAPPHTVPAEDIDAVLNALKMPYEATDTVYWSVWSNPIMLNIEAQVRALTLTRKPVVATPVTGVTISSPTEPQTLDVGATFTAIATVQPANATNKAVTWSSNSTTVATVNPTTGLVTAVGAGAATITVTTNDGGYTATVAVTVKESDEVVAATRLASELGANATAFGTVVTVNSDISITNVVMPAGVTLRVPEGKTLTVTGTLSGAGTITVEGIADAATSTFSGAVNMADGSKSRGLFAKPSDAFSGWTWRLHGRTWSDRIEVSTCNKSSMVFNGTADCRSATVDNALRYYYNWKYVDVNKNAMCDHGWRVPAEADIRTFPDFNKDDGDLLLSIWGKAGHFESWGQSGNANKFSMLWSSTETYATNAYALYITGSTNSGWGTQVVGRAKEHAYVVHCIRN